MEVLLILSVYFAPWFIAWARGHHNTLAIFALTLMLGWTGIRWVVALIWILTANISPRNVW